MKIRKGDKGELSKDAKLSTISRKFEESPIWEMCNIRKSIARISMRE